MSINPLHLLVYFDLNMYYQVTNDLIIAPLPQYRGVDAIPPTVSN